MKKEKIIIDTFTEMAPKYKTTVDRELDLIWGWRYHDFIDYLIRNSNIKSTDKVLDIATGTAEIPKNLIEHIRIPEKNIFGLDITYAMLKEAQNQFSLDKKESIHLICGSAMQMPFSNSCFTKVVCGLATHHMHVETLISESYRLLEKGGCLTIADVSGSDFWKFPGIKMFLRIIGFIYFLFSESISRAWAEADAVSNVRSPTEWERIFSKQGFIKINITHLKSKFSLAPPPIMITAIKP